MQQAGVGSQEEDAIRLGRQLAEDEGWGRAMAQANLAVHFPDFALYAGPAQMGGYERAPLRAERALLLAEGALRRPQSPAHQRDSLWPVGASVGVANAEDTPDPPTAASGAPEAGGESRITNPGSVLTDSPSYLPADMASEGLRVRLVGEEELLPGVTSEELALFAAVETASAPPAAADAKKAAGMV